MTAFQIKLAAYGGALALLWLLRDRAGRTPTADVELGVGTVGGVVGGDYQTPREVAPTPDNPAANPDMRRLINQSNLLIAQEADS